MPPTGASGPSEGWGCHGPDEGPPPKGLLWDWHGCDTKDGASQLRARGGSAGQHGRAWAPGLGAQRPGPFSWEVQAPLGRDQRWPRWRGPHNPWKRVGILQSECLGSNPRPPTHEPCDFSVHIPKQG